MMLPSSSDLMRRLRAPGYLILGIAALMPLVELALTTFPPRIGAVAWRFGTEGLLASAVSPVLIMLLLLYALALASGDRKVVLTLGVIAALIGAFLLLVTGSFALDALQMRVRVRPEATDRFLTISAQAFIKLVIQCGAAVVLAVSAIRTWRLLSAQREVPRGARPGGVMVGGTGQRAAAARS